MESGGVVMEFPISITIVFDWILNFGWVLGHSWQTGLFRIVLILMMGLLLPVCQAVISCLIGSVQTSSTPSLWKVTGPGTTVLSLWSLFLAQTWELPTSPTTLIPLLKVSWCWGYWRNHFTGCRWMDGVSRVGDCELWWDCETSPSVSGFFRMSSCTSLLRPLCCCCHRVLHYSEEVTFQSFFCSHPL